MRECGRREQLQLHVPACTSADQASARPGSQAAALASPPNLHQATKRCSAHAPSSTAGACSRRSSLRAAPCCTARCRAASARMSSCRRLHPALTMNVSCASISARQLPTEAAATLGSTFRPAPAGGWAGGRRPFNHWRSTWAPATALSRQPTVWHHVAATLTADHEQRKEAQYLGLERVVHRRRGRRIFWRGGAERATHVA